MGSFKFQRAPGSTQRDATKCTLNDSQRNAFWSSWDIESPEAEFLLG